MRILGRELKLSFKRGPASAVGPGNGGWWPIINEPYAGAWQKNDEWSAQTLMAHYAVYACATLIANDVGKLRARLVELKDGIWKETTNAAFSPVLRKPNSFQNHVQFKQWWLMSKLTFGNTYGLKRRDARGVVTGVYILDPTRVTVLVSDLDGEIYYQCGGDSLNDIGSQGVTVPASEMIHDRMNCLFHPLVGVPPLYACALAAEQSLSIQRDSKRFFHNGAKPGGILTAPGAISDDTARRLKEKWDQNYTGENAGRIAVVGDGLKFEAMRMTATDSQMIESLKLSAEQICSAFHVPPFKIGIGSTPAAAKVSDLNQIYYDDCLQSHIEEYEACWDDGLSLPSKYGTELDLEGLLRMDKATQVTTLAAAVGGGIMTPNAALRALNQPGVEGGDTVYLQQQNYSLAALARRDASPDPFGTGTTAPAVEPAPVTPAAPADPSPEEQARMLAYFVEKEMTLEHA